MYNSIRNSRKMLKAASLALATAMALSSVSAMAATTATSWWVSSLKTEIGKTNVNVSKFGAKGDGVHDDTAAIQAALDSLPMDGGTVYVPNGTYMIDVSKSVKMRSHTRLLMAPNAELHALPSDLQRYSVVSVRHVNNVRVVGGRIVGDRATHQGSTGEWGMGVGIYDGQNIVVKDIKISDCWGDGVMVASTGNDKHNNVRRSDYVALVNVTSDNNRRQGLSITVASHVYVVNSTFSNTNGTLPMAGIDIEPQTQSTTNAVRIENTHLIGNTGNGLEMHSNISDITLVNSVAEQNRGFGVLSVKAPHLKIRWSTLTQNGLAGARFAGADDVVLRNNTITYNSTRYISPTRNGGGSSRDLQVSNTTNFVNENNTFTPAK